MKQRSSIAILLMTLVGGFFIPFTMRLFGVDVIFAVIEIEVACGLIGIYTFFPREKEQK